MRKKSIITERTNEEIIEEIRARQSGGIDTNDLYLELYNRNIGIINLFICKVVGTINRNDNDDMMQEAFISIINAVENYDETKGSFTTCLFYYVRASILKYLRESRSVILPYNVSYLILILSKIETSYEKENGRKPPKKYILEKMNISEWTYKRLLSAREVICQKSFQDTLGEELTIEDTIADTRDVISEVENRFDDEKLSRDMERELDNLPPQYKDVIVNYYYNNLTYSEIAEKMNSDTMTIRTALVNARKYLAKSKRIKELYEDAFCTSIKYSFARFIRTNTSSTEASALKLYELDEKRKKLQDERHNTGTKIMTNTDYEKLLENVRAKIDEHDRFVREMLQSAQG